MRTSLFEKIKEHTPSSNRRLKHILNYVLKSMAILLILVVIVIVANAVIIWNSEKLSTNESQVENKSQKIVLYDYPVTGGSNQNILFEQDILVKSNITFEADSGLLSSVNEQSSGESIRKYDADKQVIHLKLPKDETIKSGEKTVLKESITYLSEDNEDTYRLEKKTVFEANKEGELFRVAQTDKACNDYRLYEDINQIDFEPAYFDAYNVYFPNKWKNAGGKELEINGTEYYQANSTETVRGYLLSNHEGSLTQGEDGSEHIKIDQNIRMVPDYPILTLTPLSVNMNIKYEYDRDVGSDVNIEEPEWVSEATKCLEDN